jgi:hypothetical protein
VLWRRQGWEANEYEGAYAYDQYDDAFQTPIESLMLEVLTTIMIAGRHEQAQTYHKDRIEKILCENSLEELKKQMSDDEKHELLHDLKILGFIAS